MFPERARTARSWLAGELRSGDTSLMRRVLPASLVVATLFVSPASALWSDTSQLRISRAELRQADSPIRVAQVEKAFRHPTGLVGPLEDVFQPPRRWQLMDWGFVKNGFPVADLVAYVNADQARRASIIDRSGRIYEYRRCKECKPLLLACLNCLTFRVKNVVLVLTAPVPHGNLPVITARQERERPGHGRESNSQMCEASDRSACRGGLSKSVAGAPATSQGTGSECCKRPLQRR